MRGITRRPIALFMGAAFIHSSTLAGCDSSEIDTGVNTPDSNTADSNITEGAAVTSIHVSPSGDDANPGTEDRPVKSLGRARNLARALNASMSADIAVVLADGVHRLTEPLRLDAQDSGSNGYKVIYRAASGARPVISGGVRITGWKKIDAAKNLWSAPAPAGLDNTRQLYIDGVRAHRTHARPPVALTITDTGYTASSDTMARWRNPKDIEFVWTGGDSLWSERNSSSPGPWTEPRCPVASISGTTITMAQPCWDNDTKRVTFPPDQHGGRTVNLVGGGNVATKPEYIENAYELLGPPGEWYFDRNARTIFYVPRPGEDLTTADVEAPVLEVLLAGQGTADQPIHDIVFSGLQFSYATWLFPSSPEGFSEVQANYTVTGQKGYATQALCDLVTPKGSCPYAAWTKIPANVQIAFGAKIQFLDDAFVHLGAAGLDLGTGSQGNMVQGSVFTDISGNALEVGGVELLAPEPGELTKDNRIANNHIYDVPVEFHGGIAIINGYSQNQVIEHNQIDHTAYAAISMGWGGWPDKIQMAATPNPSKNNRVANNLIFNHMQLLADGGAIYTQGITGTSLDDGEKVTGNVTYDPWGSGHMIYTDNGATFVSLVGNVMFRPNFDNWGSRHHDYRPGSDPKNNDPTLVADNYWQQGDGDSSSLGVTVRGNKLFTSFDQVPATIRDNAGLQPAFEGILTKQFFNGAPPAPEPPQRVAAFGGNGFAYVSWNPPVFEGASKVTSYTVRASSGPSLTVSADDLAAAGYVKFSGLPNGVPATFQVSATSAAGSSTDSLPSLPVTPSTASVRPPDVPQSVSAKPGKGMASVHFQAPTVVVNGKPAGSDGGSPVVSYTITASPGGKKLVVTGRNVLVLNNHGTFAVMDGLASGTYTFTITADNVAGSGTAATTAPVTVN